MIRRLLGGAAAAALVVSTGFAAIAPAAEAKARCSRDQATSAQYPPRSCTARVSRTAVPRGGAITIAGTGFKRGERVRVELERVGSTGFFSLGYTKAKRNGSASVTVRIPRSIVAGSYRISLHGLRSGNFLTANIQVLGAQARVASGRASTGSGGALPMTGTELAGLTGAGGAAVVGGAGLLLAGRRRRSSNAA